MTDKITYYAIVDESSSRERPAGYFAVSRTTKVKSTRRSRGISNGSSHRCSMRPSVGTSRTNSYRSAKMRRSGSWRGSGGWRARRSSGRARAGGRTGPGSRRRGESRPPVEGDRAFGGPKDDADVAVVVGVREEHGQQPGPDALVPVRREDERVGEVSPGAGVAAGAGHTLEEREVHHADRLAEELRQPADPVGGFAFVPVEEAGFEALVGDVAVLFGGPGLAEGGDGRAIGAVGDPDDRGWHGPRAYRRRATMGDGRGAKADGLLLGAFRPGALGRNAPLARSGRSAAVAALAARALAGQVIAARAHSGHLPPRSIRSPDDRSRTRCQGRDPGSARTAGTGSPPFRRARPGAR